MTLSVNIKFRLSINCALSNKSMQQGTLLVRGIACVKLQFLLYLLQVISLLLHALKLFLQRSDLFGGVLQIPAGRTGLF